jgi:hypothetical protein
MFNSNVIIVPLQMHKGWCTVADRHVATVDYIPCSGFVRVLGDASRLFINRTLLLLLLID